jgi:hypothetical protein
MSSPLPSVHKSCWNDSVTTALHAAQAAAAAADDARAATVVARTALVKAREAMDQALLNSHVAHENLSAARCAFTLAQKACEARHLP